MRVLNKGAQLAGRYTLAGRLGSGGMSETWLAQDRQTEQPVVLKFLSPALRGGGGYRRLLRKEWQLGSRLMHANIVRVFEFHEDDDGPFFSLQYIPGPDVSVLTGENLDVVLRPIGLIADALRYAHGKNVVHRDIKASNILLDSKGVPYLIDFGVAARADGQAASGGSAVAASPQQLAGAAPVPADDIYSLGVLTYELISGSPPDQAAASDLPGAEPPLKTKNGAAVPESIAALVSEMLAGDAGARPDAESVATRLREAGYVAGPVPARYLGTAATMEETPLAETIRPLEHRAPTHTEAAVVAARPGGISTRTVVAALAGAVLILLLIVFVLPRFVGQEDSGSSEPAAASREPRTTAPPGAGDNVLFNENIDAFISDDERLRLKQECEQALGELLSKLETLEARSVGRWGGQIFRNAQEVYAAGDTAYLRQDFRLAGEKYREALVIIDPLLDRVDVLFEDAMSSGHAALEAGDSVEAIRHYELAVAISPGHAEAHEGLARARNLELVMSLTKQGVDLEHDLDLAAAKLAFEKALQLDEQWQPAAEGLQRVLVASNQLSFDQRMTEGLEALASGDFPAARAAFRTAQALQPDSREPADGLLQVDQGIRLQNIVALEREAKRLESTEQWHAAVDKYKAILEVDSDLAFAHEGLARADERAKLHDTLEKYIADPDSLSDPSNMQAATLMLLDITRMTDVGPRLEDQKNQLSKLLKRAATPLTVRLISDNATNVAIYKVGKLGSFESQEISLRPGTYVAVGSRPGYRDVRLEFRVAPEAELQPIVVRCEEQI